MAGLRDSGKLKRKIVVWGGFLREYHVMHLMPVVLFIDKPQTSMCIRRYLIITAPCRANFGGVD